MDDFQTSFAIIKGTSIASPSAPWSIVDEADLESPSLVSSTADGWRVERLPISWPTETVLLLAPGFQDCVSGGWTKLAHSPEVEAVGFSPDGLTLVVRVGGKSLSWRREH